MFMACDNVGLKFKVQFMLLAESFMLHHWQAEDGGWLQKNYNSIFIVDKQTIEALQLEPLVITTI